MPKEVFPLRNEQKKQLKSYLIVMASAVLMGFSYELFVFPNAFAPAGLNGLITMVQYLFHINIGYLSLLLNLPLIFLTWQKLDADFAKKNLAFVLVFSFVTLMLGHMDLSAIAYHTDNGTSTILGPMVAGAISGAVGGTVIRQNGSTGGTDIVAAWVRKKYPEASFEPVILCLIYCYLTSSISDRILKGGKTALKFEIVTQDPQALSQRLIQELHHSVTLLSAQGMYSHTPRSMLICVVNRHQIVHFQEILAEFPNTFAYVSTVNETVGNFKRITS